MKAKITKAGRTKILIDKGNVGKDNDFRIGGFTQLKEEKKSGFIYFDTFH